MDNLTFKQRHKNMSNITAVSSIEKKVRLYLFKKGYRYRKNDKRYPGRPDIVLPKYKTVIFVNGCFWHQHPNCSRAVMPKSNQDYWIQKLNRNRERDQHNYDELKALGWKVIVLWECELTKKNEEKTLNNLERTIVEDVL